MFRIYILFFSLCFLTNHLYAKNYKISDKGTHTVADGDCFFDSGGEGGKYKNNENYTIILKAPAGYDLVVDFVSYNTESGYDYLTVNDGVNTQNKLTGMKNNLKIVSLTGNLKFDFESDGSKSRSGWKAIVHLTPKTTTSIRISNGGSHLVNDPIRFYDSGGAGSNYPHKETSHIDFSAPEGYDLVVDFISYNTESGYDFLKVSDGISLLNNLDDVNDGLKIVSSTGNLRFDFKSDELENESGWEAVVYKREKPADIVISDVDVSEGVGVATVRVSLSKIMSKDVSFEWCTADDQARQPSDYTAVGWTPVNINAGELYVDLKISIKDDNSYEGNEKFTVFINNSENAKIVNDRISCTILDNESAPPELSISDISVDEGVGVAVFKARLNKVYSRNVEFQWSTSDWEAEEPSDYAKVAWTKVTIPAGDLLVDLRVTIFEDRKFEGNERFTCYFGYEKNVNLVKTNAICTIIDNDSNASIEVNKQNPENTYSASKLVEDVLVTGCLTASNVTYTGDEDNGLGFFNAGSSDFPLSSGIILSNGIVASAEGPNRGSSKSDENSGFDFDENNRDSDLMKLAGTYRKREYNYSEGRWEYWHREYYDAQILEFDFVPAGDKLEFSYVFASEEYPKYACSKFNDGFAFIISGEGIDNDPGLTGKNIALIPGSTDWVTINNVNGSRDDGSAKVCGSSDNYVDENGSFATSFNGRTKVLKANAKVKPCETYHIKLIVYDNSDKQVNSAVFLEAKSFVSNEVLVENRLDNIEGDKDVMYRGCDKSYISFSRKERLDEEYSFGVTITGSAVNGVDYYLLNPDGSNAGKFPDRITFPVGVSELKYYYMASDAVKGEKDILFEVLIGCPCNPEDADYFRKSVKIFDIAEIEASAVSNVTCNGGSPIATIIVKLKENLDVDNYLYSLDGSDFQSTNRFQGNFTVGDHQVTIKDIFSCKSKVVTINVPAPTALKADAGKTFEMCERDDSKELNGQGGIDYLWTCDKVEGLKDMDLTAPNPKISPLVKEGLYTYTLTVSDGIGKACSSSADVKVLVMPTPVLTLSADNKEVCSRVEISLNADVKKAINPTYQWSPDDGEINFPEQQNVIAKPLTMGIASRTYSLEVTSDNGCRVKQSIGGIQVFPLPVVALNLPASNLCSDGTNGEIKIEVTSGTPIDGIGYNYQWNYNPNGNSPLAKPLPAGDYKVEVRDAKKCTTTSNFKVTSKPKPIGIFFN